MLWQPGGLCHTVMSYAMVHVMVSVRCSSAYSWPVMTLAFVLTSVQSVLWPILPTRRVMPYSNE